VRFGRLGPAANHREPAHEASNTAKAQQREPGEAVLLIVLVVAPLTVVLILFLIALLRCERTDIPAIMEALAAVLRAALTRRGSG
jgi:hypothetical protein